MLSTHRNPSKIDISDTALAQDSSGYAFVCTREDLLKRYDEGQVSNDVLLEACEKRFFSKGNGYFKQFIRDFLASVWQCQGKTHFGITDEAVKKEINDQLTRISENWVSYRQRGCKKEAELEQIIDRLKELLNADEDELDQLFQAHSQNPGTFVGGLMSFIVSKNTDFNLMVKGDKYKANLFSENGSHYLELFFDSVDLFAMPSGKKIGTFLGGKTRLLYQIVFDGKEWGYQLHSIMTNNKDFMRILQEDFINEEEFKFTYCNPACADYLKAREDLSETLLTTEKELKPFAATVLRASEAIFTEEKKKAGKGETISQEKIDQVTLTLRYTNAVLKKQDNAIYELRKQANSMTKRSWGRMLAGAVLCLVGAAILVASVTAALISFGIATPVSVLGVMVAESALVGGISLMTGAVGLGAMVGGQHCFFKAANPPMPKQDAALQASIENLAKQAKRKK